MGSQRPVTNREYVLSEGETIVSKTDLHGNITYANDDFVRVSGFTMDELMGGAAKHSAAS
jgi:aerotaxis receptor